MIHFARAEREDKNGSSKTDRQTSGKPIPDQHDAH